MDIAIANSPIKTAIIKDRRFFSVDFRYQPTIRFKQQGYRAAERQYIIEIARESPENLSRKSTPPIFIGSFTTPSKATRVLPERKSACTGNGVPSPRSASIPPYFSRTRERFTVITSLRLRKNVIAHLFFIRFTFRSSNFAERQRLA